MICFMQVNVDCHNYHAHVSGLHTKKAINYVNLFRYTQKYGSFIFIEQASSGTKQKTRSAAATPHQNSCLNSAGSDCCAQLCPVWS